MATRKTVKKTAIKRTKRVSTKRVTKSSNVPAFDDFVLSPMPKPSLWERIKWAVLDAYWRVVSAIEDLWYQLKQRLS